jgi:hypothetical protein
MDSIELTASLLGLVVETCRADIRKDCATAQIGQGGVAQCLLDNRSKLSSDCRSEVEMLEARLKR